jgi:hypothetical protein
MLKPRPMSFLDVLLLVVVFGIAAGARVWYLWTYVPATDATASSVLQVQGSQRWPDGTNDLDQLLTNMNYLREPASKEPTDKEHGKKDMLYGFRAKPPLATQEEATAHCAPLYPFFRSLIDYDLADMLAAKGDTAAKTEENRLSWANMLHRYINLGMGSLTAALYFLIARRVFRSTLVGFLAGLATALHPYWIINMAELEDGALCTFLLATTLWLGARGGHQGGAVTSLLFGLFLSALALTRAGMLPFAFVGLLWFLWRCRYLGQGWLCAIVAFLGFSIGISSWTVRNYQTLHEPMPIVSTAWLHVWTGNNPQANGGPLTMGMLNALPAERKAELEKEPFTTSQVKRYGELRKDAWAEIQNQPIATLVRRFQALKMFLFGSDKAALDSQIQKENALAAAPAESRESLQTFVGEMNACLAGTLVGMLALAFLGWRWSHGWKGSQLLAAAIIWIPLPYILGHAEYGHGLRLPLDGPLLCLGVFALVCLIPGVGMKLLNGEPRAAATTTT